MRKKYQVGRSHISRVSFRSLVSLLAIGLFSILSGSSASAQSDHREIPVFINNGVFVEDSMIARIAKLYQDYLNSGPDTAYDNPYWNSAEKKRYPGFDLLNKGTVNPTLYQASYYIYKPTILSIGREGDHYRIRTLFATTTDAGFANPVAITDVIAIPVGKDWKLANALPYNTANWQHNKIGSINFICPADHHFHRAEAMKLSHFVDSLTHLWGLQERQVDYYFAEYLDIVEQAKGYVYFMGYGNAGIPSGRSDPLNSIVYGGGLGENYPHEFVHIYLEPLYPNAHRFFQEGYATLLGGSRGRPLKEVLKSANRYLLQHPEFSVDSMILNNEDFSLDYATGASYAFGGLFCKMAEDKGGLGALKKLFSYPDTSDGMFQALEDVFGVKRSEVGHWVRQKMSEYAMK